MSKSKANLLFAKQLSLFSSTPDVYNPSRAFHTELLFVQEKKVDFPQY